jgi:hypothetical protein
MGGQIPGAGYLAPLPFPEDSDDADADGDHDCGETAGHRKVALREIHDAGDVVDGGESYPDQTVDASDHQTRDQELQGLVENAGAIISKPLFKWCRRADLNREPTDCESAKHKYRTIPFSGAFPL